MNSPFFVVIIPLYGYYEYFVFYIGWCFLLISISNWWGDEMLGICQPNLHVRQNNCFIISLLEQVEKFNYLPIIIGRWWDVRYYYHNMFSSHCWRIKERKCLKYGNHFIISLIIIYKKIIISLLFCSFVVYLQISACSNLLSSYCV